MPGGDCTARIDPTLFPFPPETRLGGHWGKKDCQSAQLDRHNPTYIHDINLRPICFFVCFFFWFCSLARVAYRHRRTGFFLNLSRLYRHRLLDDEKDDNSNSIVDIHHLLHHQRHHHHHHQRIIVGQAVLNWRTSNTVVCATHPACIRHGVIGLLVCCLFSRLSYSGYLFDIIFYSATVVYPLASPSWIVFCCCFWIPQFGLCEFDTTIWCWCCIW